MNAEFPPLNRRLLRGGYQPPPGLEMGSLAERPIRILQFGEGNFLRAFADWMVDRLNSAGAWSGDVAVVQPIRQGLAQALNEQEGLFTVLLRGMEQGRPVEARRLVTSVRRALNPYAEWAEVLALARRPELRFVISNTTESGIVYAEEPWTENCPDSFPAKVAALLAERHRAWNGAPDKGLVFLPCELIDRNGDHLREAVRRHIHNGKNLPVGLDEWVEKHNHFLCTLVDRIVTGYPADEANRLGQELGYTDRLLVAGEHFYLWVIEGPAAIAEELPLHRAGLNVLWTADLEPYRTRKVRVLNGAHTAGALAAFLAGARTVREMMLDPLLGRVVRQAVFGEILPNLQLPEGEKRQYAEAVLDRFANPHIRHELLSIALNSVSKWRTRVLPSLIAGLAATRRPPPVLAFSLAALICFYRPTVREKGEWKGGGARAEYPLRDEASALAVFEQAWRRFATPKDAEDLARAILAHAPFWGCDLNELSGLTPAVVRGVRSIIVRGARAALEELMAQSE